ncbi:MAG: alpha/beta hydrolase, partial [Myxococcales bacterium]|nr:alpha/beta hydrolase [Myxococcales bacterium]
LPHGTPGDSPPSDLPPAGPDDGDPNGPVVEAPGVPCGSNASLFGLTATNVNIGGRDVHVAYPCNKRAGAPVTFVLNLHGTMPSEDLKLYQVAYFSVNNHADSHNIITAAPKAVGSQWGNGDGGVDLPHIMEVIDWVYTTFADFDIRAMWIAGHSWGAMYSTNLVCDPTLADKVRGAVLQSGSGTPPACAGNLSVISSAAEMDIGPVINQGATAAAHGCGAEQTNMVGNNTETHWPGCNPGFVHANYVMLGKGHSDYMDAVVVERIADLINEARP